MKTLTLKQVPAASKITKQILGTPTVSLFSLTTVGNDKVLVKNGMKYEVVRAPATGGRKNGLLYLTGNYTY